jgi:hypothetical protein
MASKKKSQHNNPLTPFVIMGATWAVTKIAESIYQKSTGRPAPVKGSENKNASRNVLWTLGLTAALAITELAVTQILEDKKD